MLKSRPEKIVYISCDVGTLARDLSLLKEKYSIKKIELVDMFPHTRHVGLVVYLESKKDYRKQKSYSSDYAMFKEKNRNSSSHKNICDTHIDGA